MLCGSVSGGEKLMYGLLFTIYNDKAITRRNKRAVSRLLNAGCPISRPKKAMKNGAENKIYFVDYLGLFRISTNKVQQFINKAPISQFPLASLVVYQSIIVNDERRGTCGK
jgi:hypothetical protein